MAPQSAHAPNVFSARPGMLDIEFDCSSGLAAPVSSFKEEQNTRPDPSNHVVARLFYPGCPDAPEGAKQAYMPHFNYAFGLAKIVTFKLRRWWGAAVRKAAALVILMISWREKYPAEPARPIADVAEMPVMVFSHGIGGNRFFYTHFACALAEHGVCVLTVEHTDGLGSAAKPAGARDWIMFQGWGEQEFLEGCTRHRAAEVRTALRMLRAINVRGAAAEHVTGSCAQGPERAAAVLDSLAGRLDVGNAVLCGHSYGGATVADVAASLSPDEALAAAIMIDPWYPAIPRDSAARGTWLSGCPAFTIGSHAFNKPRDDGSLACEGKEEGLQEAVLRGAAQGTARRSTGPSSSVLLVPTDSPHALVDDLGAVLTDKYGWLLKLAGQTRAAGGIGGADLAGRCSDAILHYFLRTVPLPADVRATISTRLDSRWAGPAGAEEGLASALASFFDGKRLADVDDADIPAGPGCAIVQEYEA